MTTTSTYDIAIIGGGLGGLTLAIQSAYAGFNTVLYEKEVYPFHKVCGEYISLESLPFLQGLGIDIYQLQLPIINQLNITDCYGNSYYFGLPLGGFGISRFCLDSLLFQKAKELGVAIFTNTKVTDVEFSNNQFTITTNQYIHTATLAAGCFGKRSNLDIKLQRSFISNKKDGLQNFIGVKYHIKYPQENNIIALHNFKNGYCGFSKIEEDTYCLCYLTNAKNLKENKGSIKQMEINIVYQNPVLKKIFTQAEFLYKEPLSIAQISFSTKTQIQDHMLMVGDTAGLITPLCGNGMSMAMQASKLAFIQMEGYLQKKISRTEMEKNYTKNWQKKFKNRLRIGRIVQRLFGGVFTTYIFLKVISYNKWLATRLIKATHGKPF